MGAMLWASVLIGYLACPLVAASFLTVIVWYNYVTASFHYYYESTKLLCPFLGRSRKKRATRATRTSRSSGK